MPDGAGTRGVDEVEVWRNVAPSAREWLVTHTRVHCRSRFGRPGPRHQSQWAGGGGEGQREVKNDAKKSQRCVCARLVGWMEWESVSVI